MKNYKKLLTKKRLYYIIGFVEEKSAALAHLVEQLTCNQQVTGSTPVSGTITARSSSG